MMRVTDAPTAQLAVELSILLGRVAGDWSIDRTEAANDGRPRAGMREVGDTYEVWVTSNDQRERIVLTPSSSFSGSAVDLRLLEKLTSVFSHDLEAVGSAWRAQEIWADLSETRFLRAASRISPFSTTPLLKWIRLFEAAARQTYEGTAFAGSLVMVKHLPSFRSAVDNRYHQFDRPLEFEQALLREKWLKPFLQNGDFALVTVGHKGLVKGFTDTVQPWSQPVDMAPTVELEGLYGHLRPGTSVLSASPAGDIHLALPSGVTFVNSQGRWRYQSWKVLESIVGRQCETAVAQQIVRVVRSASYSHRGSLYVILADGADVIGVVPDHESDSRTSRTLRATLTGIELDEPMSSRLLSIASGIDGAIILSDKGRIVDVASMIAEPTKEALAQAGLAQLQRLAGARSTAAWNASVHGLAIKVSDDGPVDAYERGKHVFHAG